MLETRSPEFPGESSDCPKKFSHSRSWALSTVPGDYFLNKTPLLWRHCYPEPFRVTLRRATKTRLWDTLTGK